MALTTDIWTIRATEAYITVMVHFITNDWPMESKVPSTCEIPERHTGVHVSERLIDVSKNMTKNQLSFMTMHQTCFWPLNSLKIGVILDVLGIPYSLL